MSENIRKAGGTEQEEEEEEGFKSLFGEGDKAKWTQQWLAIDCVYSLLFKHPTTIIILVKISINSNKIINTYKMVSVDVNLKGQIRVLVLGRKMVCFFDVVHVVDL